MRSAALGTRLAGCRMLGVEPDERMAELGRQSGLEVEAATFENWDPAGRAFDMVIAAEAWHWVDPVTAAAKPLGPLWAADASPLFGTRSSHLTSSAKPSKMCTGVSRPDCLSIPGRTLLSLGTPLPPCLADQVDHLGVNGTPPCRITPEIGKAPREQIARPLSKQESERGEAMKIGFVGAGRIGRPILDQLARAGHECVVLARRPETKAVLQRDGLVCADTLTAAVTEADVVFVVVLNDEQVQAVCLGAAGALAAMKPGAALVQHTTCDPTTVQLIAREGTGRVRVLDAALSGGPDDIAAGRLTLWVGGDEDLRNQLQPLLRTYASPIIPVGALGNGQRVKLINNALFVAHVGLAIDAVRIAAMLDIDEQAILAAVQHGSGASRGLSVVAGAGPVSSVAERLGDLMLKDVNVVRQVAARAGVDLGIIGTVLSSSAVEQKVLGLPLEIEHSL